MHWPKSWIEGHGRGAAARLLAAGLVLLPATFSLPSASGQSNAPNGAPAAETDEGPAAVKLRHWLGDMSVARRDALASGRPILVRFDGRWCAWCRKLDAEIAKPQVQEELARWTPVVIDAERAGPEGARLGMTSVPALRVLTPQGRLVAAHDGFLTADALIEWLGQQAEEIAQAPDELLLSQAEPSLVEVLRIARLLGNRDAALREAAIRRLAPHPQAAAAAMVKTLRDGNLASRLAALEILRQWQAPLEGLDPWQPDTLSSNRLAKLEQWAAAVSPDSSPQLRTELTQEERQTAAAEIERMLRGDPVFAAAVREQLARFGPALLPAVYDQLKTVAADEERQRLVALRYRLVASHDLALRWPGGLERLADTDVQIRHRAADELASLATPEHEPLLLELFSDPDPLVREISLRGLKNVSGNRAASALINLLDDPEPNVRAAVLKQLAEDAPGTMVAKVAEYVKRETDPDLVVHAIRYFAEVKDRDVTESVLPLLEHASWQVRAEAAQVVAKATSSSRIMAARGIHADPEVRQALLKLLEDEDPFVVSRALEGLENVSTTSAVEPLVAAVERHPDLAPKIADILAGNELMREKALPHLRRFFGHERPAVRAAAIAGLVKADPDGIAEELKRALRDADSRVRIAAADAFVQMLQQDRPSAWDSTIGMHFDSFVEPAELAAAEAPAIVRAVTGVLRLFGGGTRSAALADEAPPPEADAPPPAEPPAPGDEPEALGGDAPGAADAPTSEPERPVQGFGRRLDAWLLELYAGKHRPSWTAELVEPLIAMLAADDLQERASAAVALLPLGQADAAVPVLEAAAEAQPSLYPRICTAVGWLDWPRRRALFTRLDALAPGADQRAILISHMSEVPDFRMTELLWEALERPDLEQTLADSVQYGLKHAYFGRRYWSPESITPTMRRQAREAIAPHATAGPTLKRLIAINLLLEFSTDDALPAVRALLDDENTSPELRSDAFQMLLVALAEPQRSAAAVEALQGDDLARRRIALRFLAGGPQALAELPTTKFSLHVGDVSRVSYTSSQPIIPEPPRRVTADDVRPLLSDSDPQVAANAGYLLCLFDEAEGLKPLLAWWRSQPAHNSVLDRLVYRAVAVLDDEASIPVLRTIAGRMDKHDAGEFYWTIRIMSGPAVLQFRKEVRDKFGMENLR